MLKGIDISVHNGEINWREIKNSDVKVVIIKATEGVDFVDKMLENHYKGANSIGLSVGFYHFMSEKTSPLQQARDFWNAIKDKKFNVLPCLDIEVNEYKRSRTQISDRCIEFLEEFKRISGYDCMIYTGGFFGRDLLDDRVKKYPGWIAHYGVNKPMQTGFKVVGHQYTEDGKTTGVKGDVDLNNFYDGIFINCNTPVKKPSKPKLVSQNGECTVIVDKLNIREKPSTSSKVVGSYSKGESVIYDYYVDNEGYRWISWIGASGKRRYMAVRVLSTNKRYGNCI
ncbi:hypothetical protein GCM10008916_08320 [Clostridium nitritogenes]|uniref:SH3b domain-containing protein n=1 Tax=Clostridium nitritogenes TaxID=83340 RepID=A0ABP3WY19_9CLOT